jgi:hypothetical protein
MKDESGSFLRSLAPLWQDARLLRLERTRHQELASDVE